jgi:cytochrome c oxidase subunit 2
LSEALSLWPQQASVYAGRVDLLIWAYTVVVVLLTAPVFILIAVFAVKYRRGKPADRRVRANRSILIETSWALIPFLLTVGFFVYAAQLFFQLHRPPADAMVIDVVARQWMWKFQHPEGQREINALHVPADQAIKLVMTSSTACISPSCASSRTSCRSATPASGSRPTGQASTACTALSSAAPTTP